MDTVTLRVVPALEGVRGLGHNALLLALSSTLAEEEALKSALGGLGLHCAVTETGGNSSGDFQAKSMRAVIGAALNAGLIEKNARTIHALLHAAEEAKRGLLVNETSTANLAVKIAIVCNREWVAVAMFGESSLHSFSSHERVGLGVMHLP